MTSNIFEEWNAILGMLGSAWIAFGWVAALLAVLAASWGIFRLTRCIAFRTAIRPYANYMKGGGHG